MKSVKAKTDSQVRGRFPSPNTPHALKEDLGDKGDLLIRDLWKKGTCIIHYMRVMNTNTSSYLLRFMYKLLQVA